MGRILACLATERAKVGEMPGDAWVYELRGVGKSYVGTEGGPPVRVLRDVDFRVARGEAVAVVGPSGSGKTTLLNILGTLDRADSGQVLLEGQDLGKLDDVGLARVRNRRIGFVFQSHHLLPHLTVLENVLVPTLPLDDASVRGAAPERAGRLLKRVGLGDRTHHRPGQLSGGECQRVAVVRALINQPAILLADEPTGALDRATARGLAELLRELNREEGVTLIVVTHSLELARDMGRVVEFGDGRPNEGARA
ncbi:MAG: ABC transporter ATP-binding protein [Verrucomicrobiales bacterium]|nr:ABC transporter ATP-binding protein [Verrucomicrobiales bacterium]